MPQNGFHGLAGLATTRLVVRRVPEAVAVPFAGAVTFGAMLPDVDMYPTAVAFLMGRHDLIYVLHRTLTHSLLMAGVPAAAGCFLLRAHPRAAWIAVGLALGVATHLLLDIFFWFAPIDLFWPFSHVPREAPLLPVVDLWRRVRPIPPLLINLREAFEFAAFALLLGALKLIRRMPAGHAATDEDQTADGKEEAASLVRWQRAAWTAFCLAVVTAFLLRGRPSLQNVVVTTPYLLAFLPYCWLATLRSTKFIARWAVAAR